MANKTKDMTVGSPLVLFLGFAVPLIFGQVFQQMYNLVDTMIVGKILGTNALAGVGATGCLCFLILGFCGGLCAGISIPVSQAFGAKDYRLMRSFVANSIYTSGFFAVVISLTTVILCRSILVWMKTPDDIIDYAYGYLIVIFAGIPFTVMYNMTASLLRAVGDSRTPVYFLVLASLLNIGLDFLCILGLHMGTMGAAVATVLSQAVSGICCIIYIIKKFEFLHPKKGEWRINRSYIGRLCYMGVPMGLQLSITAVGSIILQASVNTLGSFYVASITAGIKISSFFMCPFDAIGTTMATFCGQNVGAKQFERLSQGAKAGILISGVYCIFAFAVTTLFCRQIALLFLKSTEVAIIESVRKYIFINSSMYIFLVFINIYRYGIQGMGFSNIAVFAGVFELCARAVVGLILVPMFQFDAVCWANPLAWYAADAFLIPTFYYLKRRLERTR